MRRLFLFLFLFLISFAYAVPPVTTVQQYSDGYIIIENPHSTIKSNQNYNYDIFLYNYSNGKLLDNSTIVCKFYLANSSGDVIFSNNMTYSGTTDKIWYINILGSNFNNVGIYPYGVSCQDTNGGSLSGAFEVTGDGTDFNLESTIFDIFLSVSTLIIMIFFLFLSSYGINSKMAKEESGGIRFFFIGLSLIFLISHLLINQSIISNYLGELSNINGIYSSVIYVFFTFLILSFLYTLIKVMLWEVGLFMSKKGLK